MRLLYSPPGSNVERRLISLHGRAVASGFGNVQNNLDFLFLKINFFKEAHAFRTRKDAASTPQKTKAQEPVPFPLSVW
jgi:hypothetical protein